MLDTFREVYTPEGVALRLPAAGPAPRALAWLIDLAIRMGILMAASAVLGAFGESGVGLYLIAVFVLLWGYPVVCEAMFDGQTPGKRVMELRVVAADGAPIGWMASFVRNLLRTVDALPVGYAAGLITSLGDPWGRRLGDMVAGTVVVHAPRTMRHAAPAPGGVAHSHAPATPLRPEEQVAVIAFAERAAQLTQERQQELADIAAPITGSGGALGVLRLNGIANWLLGRQ